MRRITLLLLLLMGFQVFSQVKIGTNPNTIGQSSLLELESASLGLLVPRVINTGTVLTPANGMVVYDLSSQCLKSFENGTWSKCLSFGEAVPQGVVVNCAGSALNGSYNQNAATGSGSTFTLVYTNNSFTPVSITNASTDITLSGASAGLTVGTPNPASITNLASGSSITVTYPIIGTPSTASGQIITATFAKFNLSCAKTAVIGLNPTSGGSANITSLTCTTASAGQPVVGVSITPDTVTQTFTINASIAGSYNITLPTVNGITFSSSGSLNAGSNPGIVFKASGTPTVAGANNFTVPYPPTATPCVFTRNVNSLTSGGTAVINTISCNTIGQGTMTAGVAIAANTVYQTLVINATKAGDYNISSNTVNGITFSGSGPLSLGDNTVRLVASGTPVAAGTIDFTLNVSSACPFKRVVGTTYANANCPEAIGLAYNIPTTKTIGTTDVVITKTTNTDGGASVGIGNACGVTIASTSSSVTTSLGQSSTYTFSVPLKNVQIYGVNNESTEDNEGYSVTASLLGAPVRVQLVGYRGCFNDFISTQSGNSASIKNATNTGQAALVFNISSEGPYDSFTISRASQASGANLHSLMLCNAIAQPSSSNGTAVVTSYSCGAGTGTLTASSPATGVTQTVMANVTTIGTYNISTNAVNGITFSSGVQNFSATGNQPVTLTASGTPINADTFTYTLNTATGTGCPFDFVTIPNPSSNGTGVVTSYTCTGASNGTMTVGNQVTGVTQVVTANVTVAGTYNITATANGVTFSSGLHTFAGTGPQPVTLTASGTPAAAGRHNFVLNTSDASKCNFERSTGEVFVGTACATTISASTPTIVTIGSTNVTVTRTGTVFNGTPGNDCGLAPSGSQTALSGNQQAEYAFSIPVKNIQLVGWGNQVNENEGYTVTASLAGQNVPVQLSIVNTAGTCSANFTSTQVGTSGVIRTTTGSGGSLVFNISTSGTYDKITVARTGTAGAWNTHGLMTCNATAVPSSSNGTAVVSDYNCSGVQVGTMRVNTPIVGTVTQEITATVTTAGTYTISTNPVHGVTFSATSTFETPGTKPVTLQASGTPTAIGDQEFILNTNPSCRFTRTIAAHPSSNGTAVMTVSSCTTNPAGTLVAGSPATGVTQSVVVNVTAAGSYNIATEPANGIIFAASAENIPTGSQTIILTATGIPTAVATASPFKLNNASACVFTREVRGQASSGGSAIMTVQSCIEEAGFITSGIAVSGVTQTLSVDVTQLGSYNITAIAEGITFSSADTFTHLGVQPVVLTASGNATVSGSLPFSLNTTPSCNFIRSVAVNPTSNGSAVFSNPTCTTAATGLLYAGIQPNGIKQTISVYMERPGTYTIATDTQNGVSFSGSATLTGPPAIKTIELAASGTPITSGEYTYTINTSPNCFFKRETANRTSNGTAYVNSYSCTSTPLGTMVVGSPVSGVAQRITVDVISTGSYSISATGNGVTFFKSSRFDRTGPQEIDLIATGTPENSTGSFAFNTTAAPCTFTRTAINNPTSGGTSVVEYRDCDFEAFGSLYINSPANGNWQKVRVYVTKTGSYDIRTNTVNGVTFSKVDNFNSLGWQTVTLDATGIPNVIGGRTFVIQNQDGCRFTRQIAANPSSNSTARLTYENCSVNNGVGTLAVGKTIVPDEVIHWVSVNVAVAGDYNISASANGVTFAANGRVETGLRTIALKASGTPIAAGSFEYQLNTSPTCRFTKVTNPASISGNSLCTNHLFLSRDVLHCRERH